MDDEQNTEEMPAEEQSNDQETALLPRSIFPSDKDVKPGSECTFKVVAVYDDEIEVKYAHSKDDKGSKSKDESGGDYSSFDSGVDKAAMGPA